MSNYRRLLKYFWVCFFFFITSCSGTYTRKINFNAEETFRVAILPFAYRDEFGNYSSYDGSLLIDELPVVFSKMQVPPQEYVRSLTYLELRKTSLELIPLSVIDVELPHRGFVKDDGEFDYMKIFHTGPDYFCGSFMDCDAVIYGEVQKWNRSYYGVQSVNEVRIELRMISAKTGKELLFAVAEDIDSRGLSKIPTGYSSLVLEPISGLDSEIIKNLSRKMISKLIKPLRTSSQKDYLVAPLPAIYFASYDNNGSKEVSVGKPLTVLAVASEGLTADFSIGDDVLSIPMIETSPGHYYGEYWPLVGSSLIENEIIVRVSDRFQRTSEYVVRTRE